LYDTISVFKHYEMHEILVQIFHKNMKYEFIITHQSNEIWAPCIPEGVAHQNLDGWSYCASCGNHNVLKIKYNMSVRSQYSPIWLGQYQFYQ